MKIKSYLFSVVCLFATYSNASSFDVERHLQECSNNSKLVMQLVQKIDSKFSVQDATYVHQQSIQQFSEIKQDQLNDMFFSAVEMRNKPAAEVKHFLVKQCSH